MHILVNGVARPIFSALLPEDYCQIAPAAKHHRGISSSLHSGCVFGR
jgi:hypothetical protein